MSIEEIPPELPMTPVDGEVHKLDRDMSVAKRDFDKYARSHVVIDSADQHAEFHQKHFPANVLPSSAAFKVQKVWAEGDDPERGIIGFHASVNKDFFGEEYADLIPFAIDHEVYEAWLRVKRGLNATLTQAHLLARMRQIENAMKAGKAERLVSFYSEKLPELKQEFEEMYKRVKKRQQNSLT